MSVRVSGRAPDALRPTTFEIDVNRHAEGSCVVRAGHTHILCTATVEERVPPFLIGSGEGWVTAEYAMLPRATKTRNQRDRGRMPKGRTLEIQRLIGRSLRAVVDRKLLGERTITVDCDVLQADGGTRCASITGGFVALTLALESIDRRKRLSGHPLIGLVSAVSVGQVAGEPLLDLEYVEDAAAEFDLNVVSTDTGEYVEVQGTAEDRTLSRSQLNALLDLADTGCARLIELQRDVLGDRLERLARPASATS